MASLVGSSTTSAPSQLGDLKQDVELANLPEDSISDLAFNPNPNDSSGKDFLAVASWDRKLRVYEILGNGQGNPKAAADHDAPVLSCDFFKVGTVLSARMFPTALTGLDVGKRTASGSSPPARTSKPRYSTSTPNRPPKLRSMRRRSGACATSRQTARPWR